MIYIRDKQRESHYLRVASSTVEYSAFNRLVLGSNPRRPTFFKKAVVKYVATRPITLSHLNAVFSISY